MRANFHKLMQFCKLFAGEEPNTADIYDSTSFVNDQSCDRQGDLIYGHLYTNP